MNKNAGIQQIFLFVVLLVGLAIVGIIGSHIYEVTKDQLLNNPVIAGSPQVNETFAKWDYTAASLDMVFLVVFAGLTLSVLILSYVTDLPPIFFIAYLILLIGAVLVSIFLTYTYEQFSGIAEFVNTTATFPKQNQIMSNLPFITLVIGAISAIILFVRMKGGQNEY